MCLYRFGPAVKVNELKISDRVLIPDKASRLEWQVGSIEELIKGKDNLIKTVLIRVGESLLKRPVSGLIFLADTSVGGEDVTRH